MAVQAIAPKPVAPATVPAASSKSSKRGAEEEEIDPVMQVSNKKPRMEDEPSLKTLKWNFDVLYGQLLFLSLQFDHNN